MDDGEYWWGRKINKMINDSEEDWLIDGDELNCDCWWLQKR